MVPVNGPQSTREFCRIIRSKEDGSLLPSSSHQFVQFFRQILQVSDYFEETRAAFLTSFRWLSVFVFALLFLCVSLSGLHLNVIAFVCLYLFVYLSFLCEKYMKEKCLDLEVSRFVTEKISCEIFMEIQLFLGAALLRSPRL